MEHNSKEAQIQGPPQRDLAETPPTGASPVPQVTPGTRESGLGGSVSPSLMLRQMKEMIEGILEGAIDKRLAAIGVNPVAPPDRTPLPPSKEGGGNKEREQRKHLPRTHDPHTLRDLTTSLPQIQEDGRFTDCESSEDEAQKEAEGQSEILTNMLKKQVQDQQDQMKAMAKEIEELRQVRQMHSRRNVEGSHPQEEGVVETSVTKNGKESRTEYYQGYIDENSPFSADIQTDPVPKNFKTVSCEYKGQGDPEEHLMKFESLCLLHQYSEGVKCRVFLTTLSGPAQQWFQQLPRSSVHSFRDLREIFLHQFVSSKKSTKNSLYLTTIKQGVNESLRDYMTRFNEAILEIPGVEATLKIHSFVEGLRPGHFFASLMKKPAETFDELLSRVQKYINMEEAMVAKKSDVVFKRERKPDERKRPAPEVRRPERNERFQRSFTPLTRAPADLLEIVIKKPGVQVPPQRDQPPRRPRSDKFCRFHNDYGHNTNDCRNLKIAIEKLIQEGELLEYVRQESGQSKRRRENKDPKDASHEQQAEAQGKKAVITMIYGGPTGGDSNRSRKAHAREIQSISRHGIMQLERGCVLPEISFGPKDDRSIIHPHDDALVISAEIEQYEVKRVFVDTGAAVNVIFEECFNQMTLQKPLDGVMTALHGFAGDTVMSLGSVDLMLTLGEEDLRISKPVTFLVVRQKSAYNVILGRTALSSFRAVVSTYHLMMKFPVGSRVGHASGDQVVSRQCYIQSVKAGETKKRVVPNSENLRVGPEGESKKSKMVDISEGEASPQMQPAEQMLSVELFPGKTGYATRIGTHMTEAIAQQLTECLRRNADVFAFSSSDLVGVDPKIALHCLNVDPKARPVKQKLRQFGSEKDKVIREEVAKLLKAGHIREVQFPEWLSNAVMVPKGNTGTWRMCIDFRDLNKACPKDHYPLPRIDQLVDSTSGCELLSMMDAYQGYHQVKMNPLDVPKAAFGVCVGTFGFQSMPFGLKNAGATYQRMMDTIFKEQIGKDMEVYVDDILAKSVKATDHVSVLEEVFKVARRHNLKLNPAKCAFGVQSGKFLGYMVTPRGIEVNHAKVQAVLDMTPPRSVKEIQRLNGRITALSRFISRSADRSLPFFRILRKGSKFEWTEECQKAFEDLKKHLTSLPLLTKPLPAETLYLYFAVGQESLSSVLLREEGSVQKPIYYISRMIQGPEERYPDIEKGALAVMVTARKLRAYFLSHKVVVRTNMPLKQVLGKPDLSGRMVKWAIELSEYDVDFEPRAAIKAQALADFIQETTRVEIGETNKWKAYVDGSVTKEGAGVGIFIQSPTGQEHRFAIKLNFPASNNEAEYEALVRCLYILADLEVYHAIVHSDSQLVTHQVLGTCDKKEQRMVAYAGAVSKAMEKFVSLEIKQIPREGNNEADRLAKMASAMDGSWKGDLSILQAHARSEGASMCYIKEMKDWRIPIIQTLRSDVAKDSTITRAEKSLRIKFFLIGDFLYRRSFTHPYLRCLSEQEGEYLLREMHEGIAGAHTGPKDMARKALRAGFFWPTMEKDAKQLVQRCVQCQKHGRLIHRPAEEMGTISSPYPFDKWGIDIVGKFPTAPGGKVFLIVAIDYFTKWVEAEAVVKITESTVKKFIWKNICCRFGVPRILVSDNGTQFTGNLMHAWCREIGIEQRFVAVAHPQANGQVEVTNRTIVAGIKARLGEAKGNWAEELESVLWAYRTSPKTATGEAPFNLVYGTTAVTPAEVEMGSHRTLHYDEHQNLGLLRENLDLIGELRAEAQNKADRYKRQVRDAYNRRVQVRRFEKGDLVLKRADALKPTGKLEPNWEGPYVVTTVLKGGAYELKDEEGRILPRPWNVNNLKKYYA